MQVFGHWSLNGTPLHVGKDVPENGVPTHAPLLMLHPPATTDAGVNSPTNHGSLRHQPISSPKRRRVACRGLQETSFGCLLGLMIRFGTACHCSTVMVFDSGLLEGPDPVHSSSFMGVSMGNGV